MRIQTHTQRNKELHVCKLRENMGQGANDYHWTFRPTWICTGIEQQRSYERY